jgi:CheY-specific phosphatase CheX
MSDHDLYSRCLVRSVNHIFKNFLADTSISESYETQTGRNDAWVAIEFDGSLVGEVIINLPDTTLKKITKKFINQSDTKTINSCKPEVAGEIANLITGTFANQLQYADHSINLAPPEFTEDPISIKALYENINLSFTSSYGGFDVDLYYKEND